MFLQGSTAYFSLKIMGMVSFQTDITKTLTPLKGSIMKMESSLAGLLKEVTAQAAVPAPLMLRMPVDIFIAYGKMINALLNDLAKYVADSSLTVPRILALLDADVKAIQDFVTKYAPDGKGGDLDTSRFFIFGKFSYIFNYKSKLFIFYKTLAFTTKFGSAFTAMNGANSALGDALKMLNAALQTIYGTIIPLNGGSVTVDTMITSAITTQVGVFLTNVAVVQDSSDGLTKTLNAANKMQTTLTTAINQIPVAITSAVATYISDGNAAIKSAIMGYSTNSKAMLTAYGTFTAKLQSSYSDTVVGKFD